MSKSYLTYPLARGYVDHWLALGPCDHPLGHEPASTGQEPRERPVAQPVAAPDFDRPSELDKWLCRDRTLYWQVRHSEPDHLLAWEGFLSGPSLRRAWAHCILHSDHEREAVFHLATVCPAIVFLNNAPVGRAADGAARDRSADAFQTTSLAVRLAEGDNHLLVHLEQTGVRQTRLAFALRIVGVPEEAVAVRVPVLTPARGLAERQAIERAYAGAYLDRGVYMRSDPVRVLFSPDTPGSYLSVVRLQTPDRGIYAELGGHAAAGSTFQGMTAAQLPSGEMRAVLMPPHEQYYEGQLRAERALPFWVAKGHLSRRPEGNDDDRLMDLMREAGRRGGVFGELAHMALGWWAAVDVKSLRASIDDVRARRATAREGGCLPDLLGLIAMRERMAGYKHFPGELLPELDAMILGFDYALPAAPGVEDTLDLADPVNQVLLHTCRILAGQLFPAAKFTASGLTGRQERGRGEKLAAAWLRACGQTGLERWHTHLDLLVAALAHLVDLARSDTVAELAGVLLDKTLFEIAIHSFQGVFMPTRGEAQPAYLRSGRFTPESAVSRLAWGAGTYEPDLRGAVSLGLAGQGYQLPALLRAIASDRQFEVWAREQQGRDGVNTVTYRTNDLMLSSVQDYRGGQPGSREHIWQATLGPEAIVFANHPGCFSQSADVTAGWWRGNAVLPRVAQWRDALVALYDLPEDDRLGFTHAYFPAFAFDESDVAASDDPDGLPHWAFARVGQGYLALYAARGFAEVTHGPDAHRELRSSGLQNVWLCQMGAEGTDGSFEDFRRAVLATRPIIDGLRVAWTTLRGDRLEFGWTGPLLLNGVEQPITGFPHHESAFARAALPAESMDIGYGAEMLRLNFA